MKWTLEFVLPLYQAHMDKFPWDPDDWTQGDNKYKDLANLWELYEMVYVLYMATEFLKGDEDVAKDNLEKIWGPVNSGNTELLKSVGLTLSDFEQREINLPPDKDITLEKLVEVYQFLPSGAVITLPDSFGSLSWSE